MKSDTLISVVLPVYNGAAYLREAIDSVLRQTHDHFELIIINDGSTDGTGGIITSYKDARIVSLVNEKNRGLVYSLNRGLEIARGSLVARLDADDVCDDRRLSAQLSAFIADPALVVIGTNYHVSGKATDKSAMDNDYLKALLLFSTCFNHSTVMMRNIFRDTGARYNEVFRHAEDYRLWTELAARGRFGYVSEPLIRYRRHSGQVTAKHRAEQFAVSAKIRTDYMDKLGFRYNDDQLKIHQAIGNNERLTSRKNLANAGAWLSDLLKQNGQLSAFENSSFGRLIHKYWIDTCGNSSVGIRAFFMAIRSPLSALRPMTLVARARLLVKCLLRWR